MLSYEVALVSGVIVLWVAIIALACVALRGDQ